MKLLNNESLDFKSQMYVRTLSVAIETAFSHDRVDGGFGGGEFLKYAFECFGKAISQLLQLLAEAIGYFDGNLDE